jgi:hypothetical protein
MLTENFARQMAGLGGMAPDEQQQFQTRRTQDAARTAQIEDLATMLADRATQADELERSLRDAGMEDVAGRFRDASRRQAFNLARRGLAGGSAALEGQAELQQQATTEGQGVAEQARLSALEQVLKAQSTRDQLAREVVRQDPFQAAATGEHIRGIEQATADAARVAEAQRAADAARRSGNIANIAGIANLVGGLGEGAGNIMAADAFARRSA